MKPFLEDLAEKIIAKHPRLDEVTMVFPNRRAALFFRAYLTGHLTKPAWSPTLLTIEDLFLQHSSLQEADRFSLIHKLFHVYRKVLKNDESFDRFYFWGDMLLRDFDELDKYRVPAAMLFEDLSKWRELEQAFDYLTEEQKKFLKDFWIEFENKPSGSKEEFLKVWRALPKVYKEFVKTLRVEGLGYEGMIHREVADQIVSGKSERRPVSKRRANDNQATQFVFAGFNALTQAEEVLISDHVKKGATVYWDTGAYYVGDIRQEAGKFFRQYKKHPVLGNTFEPDMPSSFADSPKKVQLFGAPQKVGQAKLLGQMLKDERPAVESGKHPENLKSVIILPDESMLMAVMHSIPDSIGSVNVTMGYPLRQTPLHNLLELLLDLQIQRRGESFNHQAVTAILGHAYIVSQDEVHATELRLDIIHRNRIYIPAVELRQEGTILEPIFRPVDPEQITGYLLDVVQRLGAGFTDRQSFDREYAYHFHRSLSRLHDVLKDSGTHPDLKGFQKLFRQVIQSQKIPFTGEPLKGLQVMGVLETRNLDFDNVYILSLNEGLFPPSGRQGSYIPHGIRKAYGLPTPEHQDAIFAYLFYRVLQRATNVHLFYNTEPDILGMGEMSRLLQQLLHESGWKIDHHILSNPVQLHEEKPIVVAKTPEIMELLGVYSTPNGKGLSPTVINDYIECSLRFYLKHIAGLQEPEAVQEDLDARIFGIFVHQVMDLFYRQLIAQKESRDITPDDLSKDRTDATVNRLIDLVFREHYAVTDGRPLEYRGQSVVVRAIVILFVQKILEFDREYAPFRIEWVEEKKFTGTLPIRVNDQDRSITISGRIDRVDRKDGQLRVIDYKTGKDEVNFESIASLFHREGKRNKAAFQTILYSWLYLKNEMVAGPVSPMLMTRQSLFKEGLKMFAMGKGNSRVDVDDIKPYLAEFEEAQRRILEEMFNPSIPFTQTSDVDHCEFCLYKNLCRR